MPWIEYNGEEIADSELIIEWLSEHKLSLDLDRALTPEQRAISRAMNVMLSENTYWTMVCIC